MKIAEIERDLKHVDPKIRYWFKYQQEQILAVQQQLDQAAELLVKFYAVLEKLHKGIEDKAVDRAIERIRRGGKEDAGMVRSVLNEPEED